MLSSISWQHYLAAITILTVSYYGYVILRYYQKEISNVFNRKQHSAPLFSGGSPLPVNIMGAAKLDEGVSISRSEELYFSTSSPDDITSIKTSDETSNTANKVIKSPSQELEAELGNLITAFQEIDNKPEFITLLRILIDSYKSFKDEIDLPTTLNKIVQISNEKLMFPLSLKDFQGIWA